MNYFKNLIYTIFGINKIKVNIEHIYKSESIHISYCDFTFNSKGITLGLRRMLYNCGAILIEKGSNGLIDILKYSLENEKSEQKKILKALYEGLKQYSIKVNNTTLFYGTITEGKRADFISQNPQLNFITRTKDEFQAKSGNYQ
jgi:hypothetical protein